LINGEPFLARILRNLHFAGVRRTIIALGYRADDVISVVESILPQGMAIVPSIELKPLGTGGAIRNALQLIETDDILVVNGDSVIDYPLADFITFHRKCRTRASMLLCEVPDVSRYGTVSLDGGGRIVTFHEKRTVANHSGIINAGVYMMSRKLIATFPVHEHSLEISVLPKLCGNDLRGLVTRAPFIDIGTPDDFGRASACLSLLN
jgi:D-glycero-alpha-D-manno-heptose 1-phosphate guanylyltransferase